MGKHAKLKEKQKWSEEKLHLETARKLRGQGDGVPKAGAKQAAADSRGSRTCVCAITFFERGWHMQGWKDESTSCRGTV